VLILVHAIFYLPAYLPDSFDTLLDRRAGHRESVWRDRDCGVARATAQFARVHASASTLRSSSGFTTSYVPFYIFLRLHSPVVGLRFVLIAVALFLLDRLVRAFWGLWPRRTARVIVKGETWCAC
jgi:hypothetical protein